MLNLARPGQYLTFFIDHEIFALSVDQIREITKIPVITKVPNLPDFVVGVFNLRGSVVPTLDLRMKLKKKPLEDGSLRTVIVLQGAKGLVGCIVDSVSDVIILTDKEITPAPRFVNKMTKQFVLGIGNKKDALIMLVDILADVADSLILDTSPAEARPKAA
ncbi:MAG: chemotaxis protein CheW [Bdellovibrionota bacterium]